MLIPAEWHHLENRPEEGEKSDNADVRTEIDASTGQLKVTKATAADKPAFIYDGVSSFGLVRSGGRVSAFLRMANCSMAP